MIIRWIVQLVIATALLLACGTVEPPAPSPPCTLTICRGAETWNIEESRLEP
jgi:hypothetical protein